jgi:Lrp/AsnC family leucine-responsive transcriptional regulator
VDDIDRMILAALEADGRLSMRALGAQIHLSVPSTARRVQRLEESGVITGYGARIDRDRLGPRTHAYVECIMKSTRHAGFRTFLAGEPCVREVHRVAGPACYLLNVETPDAATLEAFLERLLAHANYRVSIVLSSTPLSS